MNKILYNTRWISLLQNKHGSYVWMNGGVMAVPLNAAKEIVFIKEYSNAYQEYVLYLPTGMIERGEEAQIYANRELQEEAGYKARRLDLLGHLRPIVKYVYAPLHIYLARDLHESKLPGDETHPIEIEKIPLSEFDEVLRSGRLQDSSAVAALYMAKDFLAKEG